MRIRFMLSILLVSLLYSGCIMFKPLEFKSIREVKLEKPSPDERKVNLKLQIYNPNFVGFRIKKVDLTVIVDSQQVTTINSTEITKAPANAYFMVPLSLTIPTKTFKNLIPTDFKTIIKNPSILIQLKGQVTGQKFLFKKHYKIDYTEEFGLQKISNL